MGNAGADMHYGLLAFASADAQVRRAKGWVRDPPQKIARMPLMLRFRDYLPEEVDLSAKFPTPGDQGQQSSCTAWATGYAMRSYYEGRRRNGSFSSPGFDVGRLSIEGYGRSQLLNPEDPASAVNRRVQITNLGS